MLGDDDRLFRESHKRVGYPRLRFTCSPCGFLPDSEKRWRCSDTRLAEWTGSIISPSIIMIIMHTLRCLYCEVKSGCRHIGGYMRRKSSYVRLVDIPHSQQPTSVVRPYIITLWSRNCPQTMVKHAMCSGIGTTCWCPSCTLRLRFQVVLKVGIPTDVFGRKCCANHRTVDEWYEMSCYVILEVTSFVFFVPFV